MWTALIHKIETIRHAPHATKKRWVIGASSIAMAGAIALWVFSMNALIGSIAMNQPHDAGDSTWSIVGNGLSFAGGALGDFANRAAALGVQGAHALLRLVFHERTITIEPAP